MSKITELANIIKLLATTLGCTPTAVLNSLVMGGWLSKEEQDEVLKTIKEWEA